MALPEPSLSPSQVRWDGLVQLALRGLRSTYTQPGSELPHTMKCDMERTTPSGINVRYALIALLGLAKFKADSLQADDLVSELWGRVSARRSAIEHSAGDLGLALWCQSLIEQDKVFTTAQALAVFEANRAVLDSVHLAWLLLGSDHALEAQADHAAGKLNDSVYSDLLNLWNPSTNLFYRHGRTGLVASVSSRIPCFANQIYPVMALAVHARRTGCTEAAKVAQAVAENLCRMQGSLGQWWWLYDAAQGGVVDGYPVFSVHQDGMAPMALLAISKAGGRSFETEISRGLSWIFGNNELWTDLVLENEGLILRDIHRHGVGRVRRAMHSAAWTWGLRSTIHESTRFVINRECRPYHLGWILYAASLARDLDTGPHKYSCKEAAIHAVG